jgi:hypothetical protein
VIESLKEGDRNQKDASMRMKSLDSCELKKDLIREKFNILYSNT